MNMKQFFLASTLSILLMPHFSYAADNAPAHAAVPEQHDTARSHLKSDNTQSVDINQADATQLATLKGIGPKKAEAIITYRTAHGGFKTVAELASVKGIGLKSLARLQSKNPGRLVVNTATKIG